MKVAILTKHLYITGNGMIMLYRSFFINIDMTDLNELLSQGEYKCIA